MARRIVTQDKDDIVTGFDITYDTDFYDVLIDAYENQFDARQLRKLERAASKFIKHFGGDIEDMLYASAEQVAQQTVPQLKDLVNKAEEIFLQEASLSRWSGNMVDNSVVGVSGTQPTASGTQAYMDLRIGVNTNEIGNPAHWQSHKNKFYGKSKHFVNPTVYTYNGYRMKPDVDYSIFLEDGTAQIPNAARWAGFVERAEERFNAL